MEVLAKIIDAFSKWLWPAITLFFLLRYEAQILAVLKNLKSLKIFNSEMQFSEQTQEQKQERIKQETKEGGNRELKREDIIAFENQVLTTLHNLTRFKNSVKRTRTTFTYMHTAIQLDALIETDTLCYAFEIKASDSPSAIKNAVLHLKNAVSFLERYYLSKTKIVVPIIVLPSSSNLVFKNQEEVLIVKFDPASNKFVDLEETLNSTEIVKQTFEA